METTANALDGTVKLVATYISNANTRINPEELQALIRDTHATLSRLIVSPDPVEPESPAFQMASKAEIKKSIGAESLISFEDAKPYKSLKRHLSNRGLTPEDYRAKWGLPADYPMVHPAYSARRSELAKSIGLGAQGRGGPKASKPAKTRKPHTSKPA